MARAENGSVITPEQLSPELRQMGVPTVPPSSVSVLATTTTGRSEIVPLENATLADALEEVERRMIAEALRRHKGNISRAARELWAHSPRALSQIGTLPNQCGTINRERERLN